MATYVTPNSPNFSLNVKVGDKKVFLQWKNCQLVVDDEATTVVLDEILASSPRIARIVSKVNREIGEKLALEHKARIGNAGVRGPVNSMSLNHLKNGAVEAANLKLQQMGASAEASVEVAEAIAGRQDVGAGVDSSVSPVAVLKAK